MLLVTANKWPVSDDLAASLILEVILNFLFIINIFIIYNVIINKIKKFVSA